MSTEGRGRFAVVTGASSGIGFELKETEVTVTPLVPGPTETGFLERAEMEDTKDKAKAEMHRKMAEPGSGEEDGP